MPESLGPDPAISTDRPHWPRRAVVTAGMPYGNKGLHFGHIGGVFIPADVYARFLRDRLGAANVLFISGTDCYGSPIDEGYRKLVESQGFAGSIVDYVRQNHDEQFQTLAAYDISLDIYEGSGLGASRDFHRQMTAAILERLYANGHLRWLSSNQFYDPVAGSWLNGRQVEGRCPWPNCQSEHAYADECDLGHAYDPADLIDPLSTLSGQRPELRLTANWYLDLESYRQLLTAYTQLLRGDGQTRKVVSDTMAEFLLPPIIYVQNEFLAAYQQIAAELPAHELRMAASDVEKSFELEFATLSERDRARPMLNAADIRFRAGKTLVPLRLTGNIKWGVAAPRLGDQSAELTVWCWPESLWAPLSFTQAYLECRSADRPLESLNPDRPTTPELSWLDFWADSSAAVYQFIGQDNIYFYGIAQTPLFAGYNSPDNQRLAADPGELQQTRLVANHHLLYFGRKASSSSQYKPPMAAELLNYYTSEQLRAHFVALGLAQKQASFRPKPLNPAAQPGDPDPVLKDGQVLTNVLNRLARSCFYTAQSEQAGRLPLGQPREELQAQAAATLRRYEAAMFGQELHLASQIAADYCRGANKYWSEQSKQSAEPQERRQLLVDCFYLLRVCLLLMHPIAPRGTELVLEYLQLPASPAEFFSWQQVDATGLAASLDIWMSAAERVAGWHALRELPPRTDFFLRHPSQLSGLPAS